MSKPRIPIGTFYMTNVCNLTCTNCATFNNFRFKGHFNWEETRPYAERWAEIIDIEELSILGGEPFAHPDLDTWVYELRKLWPKCEDFRVTTNGTMISQNADRIREYLKHKVTIEINVHDPALWNDIELAVNDIMKDFEYQINDYVGELDRSNRESYKERHLQWKDNTGWDYITMRESYEFTPTAIERINNGLIYMHRSRAEVAHSNCPFWDCHHFVNGKFYKCNVTAMSDLLHRQFSVNKECQDILNRSVGLSPFQPMEEILEFLNNLDKPIEQCQLCPEQPLTDMVKIYPLSKSKIRF